MNAATGIITTVAGSNSWGYNGDGEQATAAYLYGPSGVALDAGGNIYIADTNNQRLREVNASTGVISTVAGTGSAGLTGNGIAASGSAFFSPAGVATDALGDLFIADTGNSRVREVASGAARLTVDNTTSATTLSLAAVAAAYGGGVSLSATLLSGGSPLVGETVVFSASGVALGTGVTNTSGVATLSGVSPTYLTPGTYTSDLGASFADDPYYASASASANLTVSKAALTVAVNNAYKTYGSPDPAFAATYTGFAPGETSANLTGTLAIANAEPTGGFAALLSTHAFRPVVGRLLHRLRGRHADGHAGRHADRGRFAGQRVVRPNGDAHRHGHGRCPQRDRSHRRHRHVLRRHDRLGHGPADRRQCRTEQP